MIIQVPIYNASMTAYDSVTSDISSEFTITLNDQYVIPTDVEFSCDVGDPNALVKKDADFIWNGNFTWTFFHRLAISF